MSEELITSVSPEQVKERLKAVLTLFGAVVPLTKNQVDDWLYTTASTYVEQDAVIQVITFLLNKFVHQEAPVTQEQLAAALVEFSNK